MNLMPLFIVSFFFLKRSVKTPLNLHPKPYILSPAPYALVREDSYFDIA